MCGITGFFQNSSIPTSPEHTLGKMSNALLHRGPDSNGTWFSHDKNIGLAHQRLAIVDTSSLGYQPMQGRRFILIFNGEIYNFRTLKKEIENAHQFIFKGHSDTEVLLAALELWGIEKTLKKIEGMFAFCAYDQHKKIAYLARDRMGEKPLYFSKNRKGFLFGSELKALRQHPNSENKICQKALSLYFKHNCIPAPYSIYENTFKLQPGHYLQLDTRTLNYETRCYWSASQTFENGARKPFHGGPLEAADHLEQLLNESINDQMLADVPLGAFLSGGIDSSVVTAIMQANNSQPINTYSIGFSYQEFNEAEHAKAIAKHLGTHHTEFYVSEQDTKDVIPNLSNIYCEPFADSSQIPTYLVSKLAREHVTVALSGDGGDELFAGYTRYAQTLEKWKKLKSSPPVRKMLLKLATQLPPSLIDSVIGQLLYAAGKYNKHASTRLNALAWKQQSDSLQDFYCRNIEFWHPYSNLLLETEDPNYCLNSIPQQLSAVSDLGKLQLLDMQMYLPDDILTKVDRAAMAVSLETRVPMLNHRIVEFAASLPDEIKIRDSIAKWPLHEILSRHVPRELFERPKQGFAIPIGEWLKGPLKEWMLDLLNEQQIKKQGLFNYKAIQPIVAMHLDGNSDYSLHLWSLLMFQSWQAENTLKV